MKLSDRTPVWFAAVASLVFAASASAGGSSCGTASNESHSAYGVVQTASTETVARMDLVGTAKAAGSFQTLLAAVQAAGLTETLKGPGPFTVFAPSDEAFAKLPKGTVEDLLKPENKAKLIAVLTYHVVPGKVMAADVVKLKSAGTVEGQSVKISADGGKVKVDNANVTMTDIAATNGVIHVIDSVLMPKEM